MISAPPLRALLVTASLVLLAWSLRRLLMPMARTLPEYGWPTLLIAAMVSVPLVTIGILGRMTEDLDTGLLGLLAVALGVAGVARRSPRTDAPPTPTHAKQMALSIALTLTPIVIIALRYQIQDETALFGHKSMVEQLRNGDYPPFFPNFPDQLARYHYGFDVLAGVLARVYGLSSDAALDSITLAMTMWMSLAAGALVAAAGTPRAAPLAAFVVPYGSGLAAIILYTSPDRAPQCLAQFAHSSCGVDLMPPSILNVFQHPVSLGLPLALTLMVVASSAIERRDRRGLLTLLVIGAALFLGHIVYFALTWLALIAAAAAAGRFRDMLALGGLAAGALLIGRAMGGMLEPSTVIDTGLVRLRSAGEYVSNLPLHYVANLGVAGLMLPWFLFRAWRERNFAALSGTLFAVGGILVFHLFIYERSWDIVKFPSASMFVTSILCAWGLDGVRTHASKVARAMRYLGVALLTFGGLFTTMWLVFPPDDVERRLFPLAAPPPGPEIQQAIAWFRTISPPRDAMILGPFELTHALAIGGGLSVIATDRNTFALGVREDILNERINLSERAYQTMDARVLEALRVRYVVVYHADVANLPPAAREALSTPASPLRRVATFGGNAALGVWELQTADNADTSDDSGPVLRR